MKNHKPVHVIGIVLVLLSLASWPATPVIVEADNNKIAPWVMTHTANGAQAEFQVVLTAQADVSGAAALPTKLAKGAYVYQQLWETAQTTQAPILKWLKERNIEHRAYYLVNLIWVKADREVALALAARADVARIDANPTIHLNLESDETLAPPAAPTVPNAIEPGLTYVGAPTVWGMGYTGQGVVVGAQDTGYRWTHAAIKNKYRGWDGSTASHDYNWHDSIHSGGGACGANVTQPCDDYGHGTHTMGTMVGDDGGTNQVGMAPGAKWIGCRNMDVGNGTPTTYLECFEFFLAPYPVGGTPAQGNPALAPDVTNNSWGCPTSEGCNSGNWETMRLAIANSRAAGIMTVASAGNAGSACSTVNDPPAMFDEAYSIGAFSSGTGTIASFSSRGPVTVDGSNRPKPDISAPGVSVRSAVNSSDTAYTSMSGTSMAGPHVVGAVALLWSARPQLTNQITLTEQILNDSATHVSVVNTCSSNDWPNNVYGYGRLNVLAAVNSVSNNGNPVIGVVADISTTLPIASVRVNIQSDSLTTYTTTTNASGQFNFTVLTGTYTLTASAIGYFPASIGGLSASDGVTVTQDISLTPKIYTFDVTPPSDAQSALPGQMVTYTLALTNTGNITDTYTVTVGGNVFAVSAPASINTTAPGANQVINVGVTIPANADGNAVDDMTVTLTSRGQPSQFTQSVLTTTVIPVYGVALTPATAAQSGIVSHTVDYALTFTNTGNITDTFTVSITGTTWTTTLSASTFGPLARNTSVVVTVTVAIPANAQIDDTDQAKIVVTSDNDGAQTMEATLTTTALWYRLYLPAVLK